jgi:hypothetical protein
LRTGGLDIHEIRSSIFADWVKSIVEIDSPIHNYLLIQRIISCTGFSKAGSRIQRAINAGIRIALQKNTLIKKKDFLWKPEQRDVMIRNREKLSNNERKIEYIASEEIQNGMKSQVRSPFSISDDELISLIANMLGFSRVTENIHSELKRNITSLLKKSELARDENGWLSSSKWV